MEELTAVLSRLTVPTNEVTTQTIQVVLLKAKKHSNYEEIVNVCDTWNYIINLLSGHLQAGLREFDDQLLCATCFYTALPLTNRQPYYLDKISHMIQEELEFRNQGNKNNVNTSHVVSLMYGLFQSAFLIQKPDYNNLSNFLSYIFDLLISMAYEYSRYTYIVFKTLSSSKKLCGTSLQEHIYSYHGKLLNLVNHSWESPITGVRDLNRGIFQILVSVIDGPRYDVLIKEVNGFYWNKAKYLMLSEIIEEYKVDINVLVQWYDWVEGLLYSLHRPGLVSAGADMYYALLKKIKHEDEWCDIFLQGILKILTFSSNKATENFSNYWCLTTLKKFPSLATTVLDELQMLEHTEQKLYSCLHLLKQANKLNIIKKNWDSEEEFKFIKYLVLSNIEHYNPQIRMLSFDIVCVSHCKVMPSPKEYKLVLDYLYYNVNSDCTFLRLSMLSSLSSFLTRIQSSFMNNQTTSIVENNHLLNFCSSLQNFAIYTLNIDGNYQRKITSVKIVKLILDGFHDLPKKKRMKQKSLDVMTLSQKLAGHDCWYLYRESLLMKLLSLLKDSSDDVRENVVVLLLCHYRQLLREKRFMDYLTEEALTSMRSKFFYQTSCARHMFKLITNLLVTEPPHDTMFTSVEDLFLFGYNELATEYEMKTDVVRSIEVGKQLHSLISIIHTILEVCLQNSYVITILNNHLVNIIEMLEDISNQFSWEELTSTSSDFSKMSDMVQKMIETSGYEPSGERDLTKISGLHQNVLNCLWLNVKASCELAVLLIQFSNEPSLINRCLNIITHVLETCRHKGAIEAGGAALGRAVHHLTSLPDESLSKLPYALLRCKLKDLICAASARSSVTRRGAGLSIMVHRLVASDLMKGKPLFHYLMETLLATCGSTEDCPEELVGDEVDDQRDLPKAIYVHLLTRVVTDSGLASDMMCYSDSLADLAFGNLTSSHWQIRNAALQLYGALIPKLIGQKKASGCDDETVACDEFRTHSPDLWTRIRNSLSTCDHPDKVQAHSNLVPILNILASCARRYNFSSDMAEQKESDSELLENLISLLGSPLYAVRRLTAKCIFNIYPFDVIHDNIMKLDVVSENYLHGCVSLLAICYKSYSRVHRFDTLQDKLDVIIGKGTHSYLCRQLYEEMFSENLNMSDINETVMNVRNNVHAPGIFVWADRRIERFVQSAQWDALPKVLEMLLKHDHEHYSHFILMKITSDGDIPRQYLLQVAEQLLSFKNKYKSSVLWEVLYEISLQVDMKVDITDILKYLERVESTYKLRFAIPFVASVGHSKISDLLTLSKIINSLSNPETTDVDMRYIAALANNHMAEKFSILSDSVKLNTVKTAVILLQDEDEDVRTRSAHFYRNVIGSDVALHPNICLTKILKSTFLKSIFSDQKKSVQRFCQELSDVITTSKYSDVDEHNPFANDSKNIYMEVEVVKELIDKIKNS